MYSLMKVGSIAECSPRNAPLGAVCNTFDLHLVIIGIESKKEGKYQESIQSGTTPDPGYIFCTKWKVTTSQLHFTNEGQEVSPFPAGDHKALINRRVRKHNTNKTETT